MNDTKTVWTDILKSLNCKVVTPEKVTAATPDLLLPEVKTAVFFEVSGVDMLTTVAPIAANYGNVVIIHPNRSFSVVAGWYKDDYTGNYDFELPDTERCLAAPCGSVIKGVKWCVDEDDNTVVDVYKGNDVFYALCPIDEAILYKCKGCGKWQFSFLSAFEECLNCGDKEPYTEEDDADYDVMYSTEFIDKYIDVIHV